MNTPVQLYLYRNNGKNALTVNRFKYLILFFCVFQLIAEPYSLINMVEGGEKNVIPVTKQDNLDSLYEYNQFWHRGAIIQDTMKLKV